MKQFFLLMPEIKPKGKHSGNQTKIRSDNPVIAAERLAKAEAKRARRRERNLRYGPNEQVNSGV